MKNKDWHLLENRYTNIHNRQNHIKMSKTIYLNSMIPLLRYSKEKLRDIEIWKGISNENEVHVYGWIFKDVIKLRGPVQEKKIEGIVVKYNKATHEVYVPDLIDRTVSEICGIRNTLEWGKWYFSHFFISFKFCFSHLFFLRQSVY